METPHRATTRRPAAPAKRKASRRTALADALARTAGTRLPANGKSEDTEVASPVLPDAAVAALLGESPTIEPSVTTVLLPSMCTLRDAAELKLLLLASVGSRELVRLDAAAVERVDTAALQLLLAYVRDRQSRGAPIEWIGVSRPLEEAAARLGLTALLGLNPSAT